MKFKRIGNEMLKYKHLIDKYKYHSEISNTNYIHDLNYIEYFCVDIKIVNIKIYISFY